MTQPLFRVTNRHAPDCGEPPGVDGDSGDAYCGYFENEYGEQAIYTYDRATGEATLRMGDAGWERTYRVSEGRPLGLVLSEARCTVRKREIEEIERQPCPMVELAYGTFWAPLPRGRRSKLRSALERATSSGRAGRLGEAATEALRREARREGAAPSHLV